MDKGFFSLLTYFEGNVFEYIYFLLCSVDHIQCGLTVLFVAPISL